MTTQIKPDLCQLLQTKFSTTTDVESLLSSLIMMSTFKKCPDYRYLINACGIRYVHFLGTLDDWILLRQTTEQFKLWTKADDDFSVYIDGVLPILQQFIRTYQGDVDQDFWDRIFDLEHHHDESKWVHTLDSDHWWVLFSSLFSQSDGMNINGWFLQLCYGNHRQATCPLAQLYLNTLFVPVRVEDEHSHTMKTTCLLGGFHGVDSHEAKHKPVLSFLVVDDRTTIAALGNWLDFEIKRCMISMWSVCKWRTNVLKKEWSTEEEMEMSKVCIFFCMSLNS